MKKIVIILLLLLLIGSSKAQSFFENPFSHTYSIVARDYETGEMGAAVQSHWFSVGSVVIWGEAGVGAVATQSFVNVSFGVRGLDLLKSGLTPQQVVDSLLSADEGREFRQLAVIDGKNKPASFTGKNCIDEAGNIVGENFSVQANMMLNDKVWPAMEKAFKEAEGPLAERMIAALEAAQNEGGDIRGKQSAAILVVKGKSTGKVWEDRLIDLRVEDNPNPVQELKRLLKVHRAYERMNAGDLAVEKGDMELAMKEYSAAEEMFPENLEMKYWHAVTLANIGKLDDALPLFKEVFSADENWRVLTSRLPKVNLLNVSEEQFKRILSVK